MDVKTRVAARRDLTQPGCSDDGLVPPPAPDPPDPSHEDCINVRFALSTTLAAAAIAASISIAQAQSAPTAGAESGPVPVTISACEITRRTRTRNTFNPYPLAVTGGLHVSFVDRRSVAATEVRFRVDYRGESEVVVDEGTFSPGATISHTFDNFADYAYLGPRPNLCRVVFVRFAGGSI